MQKRNHSKKLIRKTFRQNEKENRKVRKEKKILNRINIILEKNVIDKTIERYNVDKTGSNRINKNTNSNTLHRMVLNYIRHNNTNYDDVILKLSKTNYDLIRFKAKVNEMIKDKYIDVFLSIEMYRYQ